jgi:hypothetical protein
MKPAYEQSSRAIVLLPPVSPSYSLNMISLEYIMQALPLNKRPEGTLKLVRRPAGSMQVLSGRDHHPNE